MSARPGWLFTRRFWRDALERAVRLAAGAALVALGAGAAAAGELDPAQVSRVSTVGPWLLAGGVAAAAFAMSIVTSLAAGNLGDRGTAAFLRRK